MDLFLYRWHTGGVGRPRKPPEPVTATAPSPEVKAPEGSLRMWRAEQSWQGHKASPPPQLRPRGEAGTARQLQQVGLDIQACCPHASLSAEQRSTCIIPFPLQYRQSLRGGAGWSQSQLPPQRGRLCGSPAGQQRWVSAKKEERPRGGQSRRAPGCVQRGGAAARATPVLPCPS